jgi:1,4-alpha-glucan branching enzyme
MELLPLEKLGPRVKNGKKVDFGAFFPYISSDNGYKMFVKIIHEDDQFIKSIQPLMFELQHSVNPTYGDYWSGTVTIKAADAPTQKSMWGKDGRYVYRLALQKPDGGFLDWIIDPFAREYGTGKLSAFTIGYEQYDWGGDPDEKNWKVPGVNDLVIYELMLNEFAGGIEGTMKKLNYLADLGVNCIEIMPVSQVTNVIDWGYMPNGFFGMDERFGKRRDIQRLIHEAHKRGISVILDAVYGHTHQNFPYNYIYDKLGFEDNPFMGPFEKDMFGESTNFHKKLTQDFFFTVNHFWLDCMHIDGFRYDCVPNYWDGPVGVGYANLVYNTFQNIKNTGKSGHWQRFFKNDKINIIQCAEQLEHPEDMVSSTYSNCTWQNGTLDKANRVAKGEPGAIDQFGFSLGLQNYVTEYKSNGDMIPKSALQYLENHDHSRFICNFGIKRSDNELLNEGERSLWYRQQPYMIGLFTGKGIPLVWEGEEFCENYYVPPSGWGRVKLFRPMRWDYFYDDFGKSTVNLMRKLIELRKTGEQFRNGGHYFYNHYDNYQSKGVMMFSRKNGKAFSLIALNFTGAEQKVPFSFEFEGDYQEELHGIDNLQSINAGEERELTIPSNYGRIWTTKLAA